MEKTKQRLAGDTHSGAGLLRRMAAAVVSVVLLVTGLSLHSVVNAETSLPVLETDVTQGTSDTTLVGIPGTYIQQISEALELINSYRKEACDNGYPNPSTGAALTSSDYVPIQWSDDLEYIARIRAAESSQTMGHVRTNGNSCFNIYSPNGMRSFGECLAWNYSKNVLDGIEQWYEEKSDYLNNTGGVTGHYTSMIDPKNTRVGIGTFYTKLARYPNTTCAEYNSVGSGNSLDFTYGDCVQKIEVKTADLTFQPKGLEEMTVGETQTLELEMSYQQKKGFLAEEPISASWRSSDSSVLTVSGNTVTAVSAGTASVIASVNGTDYAAEVTVKEASQTTTRPELTDDELYLSFHNVELSLEELEKANYIVNIPVYASRDFNKIQFSVNADERLVFDGARFGALSSVHSSLIGSRTTCVVQGTAGGDIAAGNAGVVAYRLPEDAQPGDVYTLETTAEETMQWSDASGNSGGIRCSGSVSITITGGSTSSATVTTATSAPETSTTVTTTTAEAQKLHVALLDVQISREDLEKNQYRVKLPLYVPDSFSSLRFAVQTNSQLKQVGCEIKGCHVMSASSDGYSSYSVSSLTGEDGPGGEIGWITFQLPESAAAGDTYYADVLAGASSGWNRSDGTSGGITTGNGSIQIVDHTTTQTTETTSVTTSTETTTSAAPGKNLTVSVGNVTVTPEELAAEDNIVELPISADRSYSTIAFGITWDSRLTYVESGADKGMGIAGQGDRFIWWANSAGGNVPAGKIGYVRFRLPEDAEDGDVYVVNLSARSAGGKDARWTDNLTGLSGVPLTVGGSIRVGASGQTTTETTVSSGTTTTTAAVQSILYGDVNVDGRVDITDAVLLNKAVSGAVSFDSQQRSNGDCDVSGEINGTDAILLMQFLAHIIDTLPDRG